MNNDIKISDTAIVTDLLDSLENRIKFLEQVPQMWGRARNSRIYYARFSRIES